MDMGGMDAIDFFLLANVNDLHDLQTPPNATKSMTGSFIITKNRTSWMSSDHGTKPPLS